MLKKDLQKRVAFLEQIIDGMKKSQLRSYNNLKKKHDNAAHNRKNNPDNCGGEDYIRGYMNGITDGIVQVNPNLTSTCIIGIENEKS